MTIDDKKWDLSNCLSFFWVESTKTGWAFFFFFLFQFCANQRGFVWPTFLKKIPSVSMLLLLLVLCDVVRCECSCCCRTRSLWLALLSGIVSYGSRLCWWKESEKERALIRWQCWWFFRGSIYRLVVRSFFP